MLCAVAPQVCENETNEEVEAWDAACEARVAAGRAAVAVVGANAATGRLSRIERQASQAANAAGNLRDRDAAQNLVRRMVST